MTEEQRVRRDAAHRAIARVRQLSHSCRGVETRQTLLAIERKMIELAELWKYA
ncbi:hypothetical protein [Azospirillum halopraeferens]|uniref:hypothetical protein n=1 Tax=Azospirillum halopraeferens TaxID=34010 RepID=UPI00041C0BF9|nr:hypothetical protein [Azospirillum halopraeferens]